MVKRATIGFAIVFAIGVFITASVMINQNIGSARFGIDWSECKQRMKGCYLQIMNKVSVGSDDVTSETVAQFCGTECKCPLAEGNGSTGWTWVPDLQRSDFVVKGSYQPRAILCHSPDCPHGTRDPRLWLVLLSDGSTTGFWCHLSVYRKWYVEVFMAGKDGFPESVR